MVKDSLKKSLKKVSANNDSSFTNAAGPAFAVNPVDPRQSPLNLQSPRKITHSCDYFFFLATYIYMRGQI